MAKQYAKNSRMLEIQTQMAERCVELLNIPEDSPPLLLLDLGCGSGMSGDVLTDAGHRWVGCDISGPMLREAVENEVEGDLVMRDLGDGLPFRPGTFDGCISVSAVQWLCNADRTSHNPVRRLRRLFETLFACMKRSARVVIQLYPETPAQMEMITSSAMRAGFTGGLLIDYPHSAKAKKYYLTLFAGPAPEAAAQPRALGVDGGEPTTALYMRDRERSRRRGLKRRASSKPMKGTREWVLKKKASARARGDSVKTDSKYTARRRPHAF